MRQRRKKRGKRKAEKPPIKVDVVKKMTKKVKITPKHTPQSLKAELRSLVHSVLDNHLIKKLPPAYIEQSTIFKDTSRSCVLSCRKPTFFRKLRTDAKPDPVAPFLCSLLICDWFSLNFFLSKQSVIFL